MRVDHVSFAAGPDGLQATAERLAEAIGVEPVDGGVHPRFGTRNMILPLVGGRFVEVVEVLDHPASDKAPFGQAVRARSAAGGGWMGWVIAMSDLHGAEARLGREAVPGNRHRPDGIELRWLQIGIKGLLADPQLPFLIQWQTENGLHPSLVGPSSVGLAGIQIAGDRDRVIDWLGLPPDQAKHELTDVKFTFVAPHGTPGLLACTFTTPNGDVTV